MIGIPCMCPGAVPPLGRLGVEARPPPSRMLAGRSKRRSGCSGVRVCVCLHLSFSSLTSRRRHLLLQALGPSMALNLTINATNPPLGEFPLEHVMNLSSWHLDECTPLNPVSPGTHTRLHSCTPSPFLPCILVTCVCVCRVWCVFIEMCWRGCVQQRPLAAANRTVG